MAQSALSNKQRRLIRGRNRVIGIAREPNGRLSRAAKAKEDPAYSWFAPRIAKEMNKHPIDFFAARNAISEDQLRAAFSWISDRAASGLPYVAPHGLNLTGVRSAAEDYSKADAARRYNEASHVLKSRCGQYGHSLIFEACIEGRRNKVLDNYFARISQRPALDPTEEQRAAWEHIHLAFKELENYYGAQPRRRAPAGASASVDKRQA